jgi:hypothetical protein
MDAGAGSRLLSSTAASPREAVVRAAARPATRPDNHHIETHATRPEVGARMKELIAANFGRHAFR